jgi:hypothetical protein
VRDLGEWPPVFGCCPARLHSGECEDAYLGGEARGGVVGAACAQGIVQGVDGLFTKRF